MNSSANEKLYAAKYEKACAIVRLIGEVNNRSIFALCDEVDLAIEYYNYSKIDIHIDSLGGSISSLDYFISKLDKWQNKYGVTIGTLGLTNVASAAAMILSLGTIGYRRAYMSAQLTYHNSRILTNGQEIWTKERLDITSDRLTKTDDRLITRLVNHIFLNKVSKNESQKMHRIDYNFENEKYDILPLADITVETMQKEYIKLHNLDTYITPSIAYKLFLIDSSQEKFEESGEEKKFKED